MTALDVSRLERIARAADVQGEPRICMDTADVLALFARVRELEAAVAWSQRHWRAAVERITDTPAPAPGATPEEGNDGSVR